MEDERDFLWFLDVVNLGRKIRPPKYDAEQEPLSPVIVPLRVLIIIPLWGRCSWKRRMSSVVAISSERFGKAANRRGDILRACLLVVPSRGAAVGRAVGVHGGRGYGGVASFLLGDASVTGARGRPVKGTVSRRAALALDWPARRFCDGYKRMG